MTHDTSWVESAPGPRQPFQGFDPDRFLVYRFEDGSKEQEALSSQLRNACYGLPGR